MNQDKTKKKRLGTLYQNILEVFFLADLLKECLRWLIVITVYLMLWTKDIYIKKIIKKYKNLSYFIFVYFLKGNLVFYLGRFVL
jgi:hypothetical protein